MSSLERQLAKNRGPSRGLERTTPLHWKGFFDTKEEVKDDGEIFNVYRSSNHEITPDYPVIIFMHGGGYSGLSWATSAKNLLKYIFGSLIAIDLRGHGETKTKADLDLSLDTMKNDVCRVLLKLGLRGHNLVLVGHSLGGSLAIHLANELNTSNPYNFKVLALVVVDVVEGSALNALPSMHVVLRNRPVEFRSIEAAIEWSAKSGHCRHPLSSRVSMPGQLKFTKSNEPCSLHIQDNSGVEVVGSGGSQPLANMAKPKHVPPLPPTVQADAILEEDEDREEEPKSPRGISARAMKEPDTSSVNDETLCKWRVELDRTEEYWKKWFLGISSLFLSISCPRLLILAGVDRLDRELTIAHMQGRFQMKVVDRVGHTVHEDDPETVATGIAEFLVRHQLAKRRTNSQLPHSLPEC